MIYHRFNQAIKTETALVHKGVQHLISSGDRGEVGIFCQIAVAPSPEVANELSLSFLFASLIDSRPVLRWLVRVYPRRDLGSQVDQLFLAHTCLSEAVLPDCLLIELKKIQKYNFFLSVMGKCGSSKPLKTTGVVADGAPPAVSHSPEPIVSWGR